MSSTTLPSKRLAIVGISGRMGAELVALSKDFGFRVTGGVSRSGILDDVLIVEKASALDKSLTDVVIDFSLPELSDGVIDWCVANKVPLVSGVTGISQATKTRLSEVGKSIPVLWAPNMSLGVAVVARMLAELKHLEGYDFQIEELHHTKKKDKPSGTALFLQEKLVAAVKALVPEPLAIRGGGIFGIHRIWAMGEEETITIEHNAMNRRVFARGALRAARWILNQPAGLYRMDDVLSLPGNP